MSLNAVFAAVSHPVRRKILQLLKQGPMSAGDLAGHFALSKPTLSVHFKTLKQAGLVSVERQGTSLIYHLNTSILEEAIAALAEFREQRK